MLGKSRSFSSSRGKRGDFVRRPLRLTLNPDARRLAPPFRLPLSSGGNRKHLLHSQHLLNLLFLNYRLIQGEIVYPAISERGIYCPLTIFSSSSGSLGTVVRFTYPLSVTTRLSSILRPASVSLFVASSPAGKFG